MVRILQDVKNIGADIRYCLDGYVFGKWNDVPGHKYINEPMTEEEWNLLSDQIYGNQYIEKQYMDIKKELMIKGQTADLVKEMLPDIKSVCDAGANRGYLMKAFQDRGVTAYGFDILENKNLVLEDVRKTYTLGSILNIPDLGIHGGVDCVISIDVFEHIPINYSNKMVSELKKLNSKYMVIGISKDMISAGHITLKSTKWWEKKFLPEYRIMKELKEKIDKRQKGCRPRYQDTGIPRNGYNKCPGIIFFRRTEG